MRRSDRRTIVQGTSIFVGMLGLALGCGTSPTSPDDADAKESVTQVAATVAQVAAAITGQSAPMANEVKNGKNLGFDTYAYPGDRIMRAWKSAPDAKYSWVGYYLPSPCHKGRTWVGKRQTLTDMGWGLAVVYVGQQTWDRQPRSLTIPQQDALIRSGKTCNADLVGAYRGTIDGRDAVQIAKLEGFSPRSIVFLDIERMEKMPEAMRDYYRAWARTLLTDGNYRPGAYVHKYNAQAVYDDLKLEFAAAGLTEEPRIWVASGRDFDEGKAPQDVGFQFAGMWQGFIDVARAVANIQLPVDVNVSNWSDPSAPEVLGN